MTPVFVPESFAEPAISPATQTLFRRTPYISPSEFNAAPTAVATSGLVPGGTPEVQLAALAAVISRASDWLDTLCFHKADGTLAASPSTESAWVKPRDNGSLALICNFVPVLEVDALALGTGPSSMQNIGQQGAENLTIEGPLIWLQGASCGSFGPTTFFPGTPTVNGRVWAVWRYVNGYPHAFLAKEAKAAASAIEVGPSVPGGSSVSGVYAGTQLTIHDGANTEVIVVSSVEGLKLNLVAPLAYTHKVPAAPDSVRVSAVPWVVEQACISLTSCLIKMRGSRALVMPSVPGQSPSKQALMQAGGLEDYEAAFEMLRPFATPYIRST